MLPVRAVEYRDPIIRISADIYALLSLVKYVCL